MSDENGARILFGPDADAFRRRRNEARRAARSLLELRQDSLERALETCRTPGWADIIEQVREIQGAAIAQFPADEQGERQRDSVVRGTQIMLDMMRELDKEARAVARMETQ